MNRCLRFVFAFILLISLLMQFSASQTIDIPPPSPTASGGGGGGSRQIDFDRIFKALQEGKQQKPQKFEEMKKLLYIEPFITKEYSKTLVLDLDFKGNKTLDRNQEFVISAYIENNNPIEIRRALFLHLEALEPGEKAFRQVNSVPQIIQVNEYEDLGGGRNFTYRAFPELTDFKYLKEVGPAVLRLKATDGQYTWTSKNTSLEITNRPPVLSNLSIEASRPTRYNDPINYVADVFDEDQDAVNVSLHILDVTGRERRNATQIANSGERINFVASQYGFFDKEDAGKNFSYYYSFGDGINVSTTDIENGPNLKKSTTLWVGRPAVIPEERNQYWWQYYNFSLVMKNQEPEDAKVQVTLYTDTKSHPWKAVSTQEVILSGEQRTVFFNVRPFDVLDVNQPFRYKFVYSEYDQNLKDNIEQSGQGLLNAKLVRYDTVSAIGLGNIAIVLLFAFLLSILVERRFFR
jgi:hypothetical protein